MKKTIFVYADYYYYINEIMDNLCTFFPHFWVFYIMSVWNVGRKYF